MARFVDLLIQALSAVNAPMGRWARNLAGLLLAAMAGLVLLQIASRAAAGVSFAWAEEAARVMLVWSAFLVAPYAHRIGANIAVNVFEEALPRAARLGLVAALNLAAVAVCGLFFVESLDLVSRGLALTATSMPVKVFWFYLILPFAFASLALVGVELALRALMGLARPDADYAVPAPDLTPPE